jgi:hypothetical protein
MKMLTTEKQVIEKRMFAVGRIEGKETDPSPFEGAQVALINEDTWCVIGPNKRWSGTIDTLSLSELDCPIVITTEIAKKNILDRLIKLYVTIEGIHDLDRFLHQVELIGGVVHNGDNGNL